MQAVMAFMQRRSATAPAPSSAAASALAATTAGKARGKGGSSGKTLGGLSRGVSILGSVMEFASGLQKAGAMEQEARDERMQARGEFIQSVERTNAIDSAYNALVADQMAASAAMGIDVASGSVTEARNAARDEAERERRIIRNSADANAALRRLRAVRLKDAARTQKVGSFVKLGLDVASSFVGG